MNRFVPMLLLLAMLVAWVACSDDPVRPSGTPLVAVMVVDTSGQPVTGLRIGSINHSEYIISRIPPSQLLPSTQINFSLPATGPVTLTIYNYYGEMLYQPLKDSVLDAGQYIVNWDASDQVSGFYRYEVVFADTSASRWVVLEAAPDPQATIIGMIDGSGQWETSDTLLFPCLLGDPPAIERRDQFNNVIDTVLDFYNDTATFTLSDTAQPDSFQYFERSLSADGNEIELIWE
jgi:hypothetical protein